MAVLIPKSEIKGRDLKRDSATCVQGGTDLLLICIENEI